MPLNPRDISKQKWINETPREIQVIEALLGGPQLQYLYVNDATTNISGWTPEEIRQGGLLFGHRKTHPWDLLQIVLLSAKVLKRWKTLTDEDKLQSRFSYDIRIRHKNGEHRRIQQHAYTLSVTEYGKPEKKYFAEDQL